MTQAAFNIFDALSAWGKTLPTWQRCLLNKLVSATELSEEAMQTVFIEAGNRGSLLSRDNRGEATARLLSTSVQWA